MDCMNICLFIKFVKITLNFFSAVFVVKVVILKPTSLQFTSAFRKLLIHAEVKGGALSVLKKNPI